MSDWLEKIHAHADGELDQEESAEVDALLAQEPSAASEHQWAVYLKETLKTRHVKPDHQAAWRACLARLDAIDALAGSGKVDSFVGRFSWGFAAALFAIILFAGFLNRGGSSISEQQLAGLFMASTNNRVVQGADEADDFARTEVGLSLPEIGPVYRVTQVGKGQIQSRNFLRADLVDNTGTFRLFIVQGPDSLEGLEPIPGRGEFSGGTVNGQSCVAWSDSNVTYVLVAPRTTDEVVSMADGIR
jgi:hypothetical protein